MMIKVKFTQRSKDLYRMTKELRRQKKDLSTNQKIIICLDKQNNCER